MLSALFLFSASFYAKEYTQNSTLSVMGKKNEAKISFSFDEEERLLSVNTISYRDKIIEKFSIKLKREDKNGTVYSAENCTVISGSRETKKEIYIISVTLNLSEDPDLALKFKPGKMPFAISLIKS